MKDAYVILDDQVTGRARTYTHPVKIITITNPTDVSAAFEALDALRRDGYYLAGWLSYDLGAIVEPALTKTYTPTDTPLLQVGVFEDFTSSLPEDLTQPDAVLDLALTPVWSEADYTQAFTRVQDYIASGDVYQVNLTFPMTGTTPHDARSLYRNLRPHQAGAYGGIASLGDTEIISLSPELFLDLEDGTATLKPMKGTLPRLPDPGADARARIAMTEDIKSRAENLMIVDLLRNDLSRIAQPGSVKVPALFTPETYATVHQMTSTIRGQVAAPSLADIVTALFPCGSVTGAPKIRAMEIIHELESTPRGAYCGSLFYFDPPSKNGHARASFNVTIRTLIKTGDAIKYHVGSGVVADSDASDEYRECLLKSRVLHPPEPGLIETLKLGPKGYVRLGRHLSRLERSARALDIPFDFQTVLDTLSQVESDPTDQRVRIGLARGQPPHILATPLISLTQPVKLIAGSRPLTSDVQPTAHKVTNRAFYDAEYRRATAQGADEAILLNADGEVCEGTFTSVFIERDGILLTPPLSSGLLPGVLREYLIDEGRAKEAVLTWQDLLEADTLYVGNSLRGLMIAEIV